MVNCPIRGFPDKIKIRQPNVSSDKVAKAKHFQESSPLISGLYAMLLFDIGLVLKISQFIAVDVSFCNFIFTFDH